MAHISRRSFHARLRPFHNATVALGLVVLALLAPACTESRSSSDNGVASLGGSSDETSGASGTGQKPFEEAGLDYAECMRTNGIDMPVRSPEAASTSTEPKSRTSVKTSSATRT